MMGLRAQLQARVASCATKQTQHATNAENYATGNATDEQQHPVNPHGIRVSCATGNATATQQGQEWCATEGEFDPELRVAFASTRNTQLSTFAAHRLAKEVIAAAMKRCDQFNDNAKARAEMVRQVLELSPAMQADLLAHFQGKPVHFD